jgi:CubicO group peptidase (beta-lactamase class C family)
LVESGEERGLQVAVYRHGELVVDAVAGVADPETGRPFASDTPVFSYSIGKGVAATVVHVLAEREYSTTTPGSPKLWPEFGAHGKERRPCATPSASRSGCQGLPDGLTVEDLTDWEKMCAIIADSEPWWEPGTRIGYHAITWGYIVGEIVRRATGEPISQVLREEVAKPLGVADELFFRRPRLRAGQDGAARGRPGQRGDVRRAARGLADP